MWPTNIISTFHSCLISSHRWTAPTQCNVWLLNVIQAICLTMFVCRHLLLMLPLCSRSYQHHYFSADWAPGDFLRGCGEFQSHKTDPTFCTDFTSTTPHRAIALPHCSLSDHMSRPLAPACYPQTDQQRRLSLAGSHWTVFKAPTGGFF